MTTAQFLLGIGIGALTGVLAALCGVGGGLIMVPAFVFLMALDQKSAVATSLAVIIPTSLNSARGHWLKGTVDMELLKLWAVPVVLGVLAGAALLRPLMPYEPGPIGGLDGRPVFIAAGTHDPYAPVQSTERLQQVLADGGADVTLSTADAAHELVQADLDATAAWFAGHSAPAG